MVHNIQLKSRVFYLLENIVMEFDVFIIKVNQNETMSILDQISSKSSNHFRRLNVLQ